MRMDNVFLKRTGRIAEKIREEDYDKLSDFILTRVEQAGTDGISLHDLVAEAQQKFDNSFYGNVSWYLLQVKYDLESRKLIQKTISPQRSQIIRKNTDKKMR